MLSVSIGPFALAVAHILVLVALALATLVGWLVGRRRGGNPESKIFSLFLIGLLAARVGFVVAYWPQYRQVPLQALDIRDGGFLAWAGVVALLLAAAWQGWRNPHMRSSLAAGLVSGLVFWLAAGFALDRHEQGSQLPAMTFLNAEGESVKLADFQGRPLVVNLWATWCPPCRREMPVLQTAQNERKDVVFLFVNQQEDVHTVNAFTTQQGLKLRNLLFDHEGELGRQVGSVALPTTLFYDAKGRRVGSHLGELSSASLLRYLEAIGPAAAP
jgi:thiol-disulfide isomerase/thioredoxin